LRLENTKIGWLPCGARRGLTKLSCLTKHRKACCAKGISKRVPGRRRRRRRRGHTKHVIAIAKRIVIVIIVKRVVIIALGGIKGRCGIAAKHLGRSSDKLAVALALYEGLPARGYDGAARHHAPVALHEAVDGRAVRGVGLLALAERVVGRALDVGAEELKVDEAEGICSV